MAPPGRNHLFSRRRISKKGEEELNLGRFGKAYAFFKKAIKLEEGNLQAKDGMTKLGQKAEEIFRQAYLLEKVNLEEAMEKWEEIVSMVPPENEYYTKSQERIAAHKK
jgi:tetratricopeptide (TPR) repeat protein